MSPSEKTIRVATPRVENSNGVSRVTSDVDGVPLWFESADVELMPSPEAFASALLLTSVHRRRPIVSEAQLSDLWMENSGKIMQAWREWWRYTPVLPIAGKRPDSGGDNPRAALLFSAGVDSYHSLLGGSNPDILVSVHGFDIPLGDTFRMDGLRRALYATAEAHNKRPVVIRTNLRDHPSVGKPHLWERSHGGALAGIGHLLSREIGRVIVSASWYTPDEQPWGSHSRTDALFSANGLTVHHFGNDTRREEKVAAVALDPTASKHLRVCYKNLLPDGNCSRCEKCIVTMLHLMEHGVLREFDSFDSHDFAARVGALPFIHYWYNVSQRILKRGRLEPDVARSLAKVLARSRRAHTLLEIRSRIRQAVGQYV